MDSVWISSQAMAALRSVDGRAIRQILRRIGSSPNDTLVHDLKYDADSKGGIALRIQMLIPGHLGILDAHGATESGAPHRSVLVLGDVIERLSDGATANTIWERVIDISDFEESRRRTGLKHVQEGDIHAYFIGGGYERLHFVLPDPGLSVCIETVSAELWQKHGVTATLRQPSRAQQNAWMEVHRNHLQNMASAKRIHRKTEALVPPLERPLTDTWIAVNRLRELGLRSDQTLRHVLDASSESDLVEVIDVAEPGELSDETLDMLLRAQIEANKRRARRRERVLASTTVLELGRGFSAVGSANEHGFDDWLRHLTREQEQIVTMDEDRPVRLRGGPGTGKTLTALMRAGYLARRAKERGQAVKIGVFFFNHDLAVRASARLQSMGLDEHLDPDSPQAILVTSLHSWCAKFVKLDELGVEPLTPYRADGRNEERRAAIELAIEEARRVLPSAETELLWAEFNARSKRGLWEIETEISQFVKAQDLTTKDEYLKAKRPSGWWMGDADRRFRTFIWEVVQTYDRTLRQLALIDADDLVNDALREVRKNVWQNYKKNTDGFDYVIVDEAQDFFRHQLMLVSRLVKAPDALMLCYDPAQAVYERYPSLRELGLESGDRFHAAKLVRNFRSTKTIVSALKHLASQHPHLDVDALWGMFEAGDQARSGVMPAAFGFKTDDALLQQIRDRITQHQADGVPPCEMAVIGFDADHLATVRAGLEARGVIAAPLDGTGRRIQQSAVSFGTARDIKGQQFEVCFLVGLEQSRMPDLRDAKTDAHRDQLREDDLRKLLVAASRARANLYLLWAGSSPSEFVTQFGDTIEQMS